MSGPELHVPWSDEERQQLRRLFENGLSLAQMGQMLGRSKYAVERQVRYLGLVRSGARKGVPEAPKSDGRIAHRVPKVTLPPLPSLSEG